MTWIDNIVQMDVVADWMELHGLCTSAQSAPLADRRSKHAASHTQGNTHAASHTERGTQHTYRVNTVSCRRCMMQSRCMLPHLCSSSLESLNTTLK